MIPSQTSLQNRQLREEEGEQDILTVLRFLRDLAPAFVPIFQRTPSGSTSGGLG